MPPKPKEDKTVIKQFKSGESSWWVNYAHYHLNEAEELIWCSGEVDKEELRTSLLSFLRRNKKSFKERLPSVFDSEPKQYNEILPCTDMKGKTVGEVFDLNKKLLIWFRDKYTFKIGEEKLKQEITEILKK